MDKDQDDPTMAKGLETEGRHIVWISVRLMVSDQLKMSGLACQ